MKILFIAHSAELSGGANRSLFSVMIGLRDDYGVSPALLVPDRAGELVKACVAENIPVYTGAYHTCCTVFRHSGKDILRFCKLFAVPVADWFASAKLNRELPADFDLFYTNERMVVAGAYLAHMRKKPHIWHVRSFARENATCYPPFYYKLMDRYSRRIVLISNSLFRSFEKHIDREKLRMVHNGIEMREYSVEQRVSHNGWRLLLTGRIVPPKGQMDAVRALEILNKKRKDQFELYFAGDIPVYDGGSYKLELQRQIERAGLNGKVHFLGEVQNISGLRKKMDMELVCSWCETFGRVTVEAMCAKLPVIGANSGGTPEIIVEGETGLLYTPHDAAQLAEKILWCADHPKEADKMAEKGYQRVRKYFTIDSMLQNIYSVISEVTAEERKKS